ncbi:hypothetical protein J4N42_16950 [Vibrio sp. SCSIO 43135]|uniref:Uncharacterized protein n=1 Tax=Vibrio paucivorans TaxID=2829489 RepID=A0A9X3HRL5_9VIBR|nr:MULTISPECIES: hypothetical protein [Vibrio]MCW8334031.1 hypothetical protein [Vibrio paucivorans]USD44132.1 hypothetical protein J4N42_16950 [Vibrio sp. SCSIO 43135]
MDECNTVDDDAGFLDSAYARLNTRFCQPAVWFDNFFIDERADEDARAGTLVRWYNDFSWVENEGYKFKTKLKARFHLPKVTRRLKVVFESDEESDVFDLFPQSSEDAESTLGLRYDWLSKGRSSFNFRVTARPSIEARYQYTYPFTIDTLARFTQKVYQRKRVTGESTQLDIDHSFSPEYLLRWTSFGTYEDDIKGWELGSGVTLYQHLSDTQAMSYQASTSGTNRPYHYITNTHLSVTYRQNIWRDWLFYELKPEYNWNKEEDIERYEEAKFTLRLEITFHNI